LDKMCPEITCIERNTDSVMEFDIIQLLYNRQ